MNKFIYFLVITVSLISKITIAQQLPIFDWNKVVGGPSSENVVDYAIDKNGNSIVLGTFKNTVNFDPQGNATFTSLMQSPTQYSADVFVAKYDANGNFMWVNTIGGYAQDEAAGVKVDTMGNVYVLAHFYDSVDYDVALGWQGFVAQPGLSDIILVKYNAGGNLQWAKQIGGPQGDKAVDIALDAQSNIVIIGTFFGTADFDPSPAYDTLTYFTLGPCSFSTPCTPDMYIAKYDSNGNHLWAKQIGGPNNENPRNVECDKNGHIYASGIFVINSDFNLNNTPSAVLNSVGTSDSYVAKYDPNGSFEWVKRLGGTASMTINDLKFDNQNNFCITGGFQGYTDFDWGADSTILYSTPGTNNIYIAKYDSSAQFKWAINMEHLNAPGQDNGTSISFDNVGNVFATGYFYGQNCDFNPDATATNFLSSAASNNNDIYIAKYSPSGAYKWAYSIGDGGDEQGVRIKLTPDNTIHLATNINSSNINFDVFANTAAGIASTNGSSDFTITQYTQCGINIATGLVGNTITAFANNVTYQWLNCEVGFAPIANATLQSYTPTTSGSYACIMTSGACVDTTICVAVDLCVGITNTITMNAQTLTLTCSVSGATYQWIRTDVGNQAIVGATSQTYTPTVNGSYACKITKNGCVNTSAPISVDKVGLDEFSDNSGVDLYPNPANDFIVVSFTTVASNIQVQLFDVLGKLVDVKTATSKNNITINTETLSKGVYTVKLTDATKNNSIVRRFIKE